MSGIIIVIGTRLANGGAVWFRSSEEQGPSPHPQLEPEGGGGGEVWNEPEFHESLVTTCTTMDGAAHRIARKSNPRRPLVHRTIGLCTNMVR